MRVGSCYGLVRRPIEASAAAMPASERPTAAAGSGASPALSAQATSDQAASLQATSDQAASPQATDAQAASLQATSDQAASDQAASDQAASDQAASDQATSSQCAFAFAAVCQAVGLNVAPPVELVVTNWSSPAFGFGGVWVFIALSTLTRPTPSEPSVTRLCLLAETSSAPLT